MDATPFRPGVEWGPWATATALEDDVVFDGACLSTKKNAVSIETQTDAVEPERVQKNGCCCVM